MIISYKHNFIYFRSKKTGSSSIEAALAPHLGPDDVIAGKIGREIEGGTVRYDIQGHTLAADVQKMVTPEFWNNCFRFSSERHPYEKAVSMAFYKIGIKKNRGEEENDFDRRLNKIVKSGIYRSFEIYSIDGVPIAQDFIRHENLESDLRRIGVRLGVAIGDIPALKTNHRTDRRPAREILSDKQKKIVYRNCREEFELFGYEV